MTPTMVFLFLFIPCILCQYKHHPEAGKEKNENNSQFTLSTSNHTTGSSSIIREWLVDVIVIWYGMDCISSFTSHERNVCSGQRQWWWQQPYVIMSLLIFYYYCPIIMSLLIFYYYCPIHYACVSISSNQIQWQNQMEHIQEPCYKFMQSSSWALWSNTINNKNMNAKKPSERYI
jgi:hypothetical protein